MDLFQSADSNLLPFDGELFYHPSFFTREKSDFYFDELTKSIPWQHDEVMMFGKKIITKRKVAWYGDEGCSYTYSKILRVPISWNETLLEIKNQVEEKANTNFNSCLLNLYHDGSESMAYHADDEPMLEQHGTIASVSFGEARMFQIKHNTKKEFKQSLLLEHGSLLVMKNGAQIHYKHQIPKATQPKNPRINLTFRKIL
jgi:alkylated DNA repair dioxygenase AlkB